LSSTRRDDEILLRRKKKVLNEVHRLLRKLARLQKLKMAWKVKVHKGNREIAETLRVLIKKEKQEYSHTSEAEESQRSDGWSWL